MTNYVCIKACPAFIDDDLKLDCTSDLLTLVLAEKQLENSVRKILEKTG